MAEAATPTTASANTAADQAKMEKYRKVRSERETVPDGIIRVNRNIQARVFIDQSGSSQVPGFTARSLAPFFNGRSGIFFGIDAAKLSVENGTAIAKAAGTPNVKNDRRCIKGLQFQSTLV